MSWLHILCLLSFALPPLGLLISEEVTGLDTSKAPLRFHSSTFPWRPATVFRNTSTAASYACVPSNPSLAVALMWSAVMSKLTFSWGSLLSLLNRRLELMFSCDLRTLAFGRVLLGLVIIGWVTSVACLSAHNRLQGTLLIVLWT